MESRKTPLEEQDQEGKPTINREWKEQDWRVKGYRNRRWLFYCGGVALP